MNIIAMIIMNSVLLNLFRIYVTKIERENFKDWLLENNYTKFLNTYSKYEKEEKVK